MEKESSKINVLNDVTRISEGTVIVGDLSSVNDIRVDGRIEGCVYSKGKIVFGEKASVEGALICDYSDVWGKIKGDVYIKDTLSLKSSSLVEGHINVNKIQVEIGSKINGTCKMIAESEYNQAVSSSVKAKLTSTPVAEKK